MRNRKAANSAATRRRWRGPGPGGPALALLALTWAGAPGDARADTIVLKNGEVLEGSIIDATRNTVVVQRMIGGMRQMPIRDIEEVRIELAQGQTIAGQLLSWADGVYQVRAGGQVVRISEGDVLSREAAEGATGQPPANSPSRPGGPQTVRMAAAPAASAPEPKVAAQAPSARGQMAVQAPERENRGPAAGADQSRGPEAAPGAAAGRDHSPPAAEEQSQAADQGQSPPAGEAQSLAAVGQDQDPAAGEDQSPPADEGQSQVADQGQTPPAGEAQSVAAVGEGQDAATGEKQSLAVKASVDPAEPGADNMVFRIELSRPAEQTVVLIYGTVEGTAKAGEDFEPQQGMVTLAPGSKSAEVHVPLIEQPTSEGEKRFELFLAADPKVAEVVDKRIVATINGGD